MRRTLGVLVHVVLGVVLGGGGSVDATRTGQDAMFSEARAYERFMGRWSRQLAPLLVRFAGVRDGESALDVGAGTGALAAALASAMPRGQVVGIDPAASYVAWATTQHGGPRVRFQVGDAQRMDFAAATFDRAVSLLVLNFVPDPAAAVDEMRRVTRPGGTIAAAVWDYGGGMEMLRIFWDEAIAVRPAAAARDERHMPLCREGDLAALWRRHGLQDVVEQPLVIETRFASFDDYWAPFLEKQGPAGAFVSGLTEVERDALQGRLRRRLVGEGPDGPIALKARAWAVRGVVR